MKIKEGTVFIVKQYFSCQDEDGNNVLGRTGDIVIAIHDEFVDDNGLARLPLLLNGKLIIFRCGRHDMTLHAGLYLNEVS